MKKIASGIISLLCILSMIMAVSVPVFAVDYKPSVKIVMSETKKKAEIKLNGVGEYIYSVQLTLDVSPENEEYTLTGTDKNTYSVVKNENGKTVLYVDFSSLADGTKEISLASLNSDRAMQVGSRADLIVINRSMRGEEYKNITVSVTNKTVSNDDEQSGSGGKKQGGGEIALPNQGQTGTVTAPDNMVVDTGFSDVPLNFWANSSIKFVTEKGLFEGTSESTFDPHAQMTRGMYVTVLSRFGDKIGDEWRISCDNPAAFSDIAGDEWFAEAAMWAGGTGLVSGIDEGIFGPYYPITREQIAVMTVNFARLCGKTLAPVNQAVMFTDGDSINDWAKEAVMLSQCAGLIYGREDGTFAPQDTATRSEVAAILTRFVQNIK